MDKGIIKLGLFLKAAQWRLLKVRLIIKGRLLERYIFSQQKNYITHL